MPRDANLLDVADALRKRDPAVQVLLDDLPGFPDNVTRGAEGRYWVGLTKPRSDTIDAMAGRLVDLYEDVTRRRALRAA